MAPKPQPPPQPDKALSSPPAAAASQPATPTPAEISTNKAGTLATPTDRRPTLDNPTAILDLSSAPSSSGSDPPLPPEDDNLSNARPSTKNIRGSRSIKPLTWYQKISVNAILGGALGLLKRLTAFPMLSSAAIYFDEDDRFDTSGNRKTEPANDTEEDMNPPSERVEVAVNYERATQALFEAIIRYRKEAKTAKDNYHTMKVNLAQFPEWNDNLVDRLRSTFQVFDITGDGLLDFEEFCTTLDEFGDGTQMEVRKKYFATIDDGSGSIDFMEFIRLVYKLTVKTPPDAEELAQTFQSIDRNMGRIRSLDVVQQLQAGLF